MTIFSFLMIIQSIIIGIAVTELLNGVAKLLRNYKLAEIGLITPILGIMVLTGLLQIFWETWGLQHYGEWTFPEMLLMLSGPIFLYLIAHLIVPETKTEQHLTTHYFLNKNIVWTLALLTVVVGVLFRPIAFGEPLFVTDNVSSLFLVICCILLIALKNIWLHRILLCLGFISVLVDTLAISYAIQ
ncbi:hypothetical protein SAMN02745866_00485 [Alteromonadaceae bacterium Bs31]|nr:hypothetical protein SAMN02745866_00485 [Alteromonadaceae bacterium Bs31]